MGYARRDALPVGRGRDHHAPAGPEWDAGLYAPADPARGDGDHAVHLPGLAGPDGGNPRRPGDCGRFERVRAPVLDRDGVSAHLDGGDADLWQGFGHLRAAGAAAAGAGAVHCGQPCLRVLAVIVAADRGAGVPGPRRGRVVRNGAGGDRRRCRAAGAWAISGLHGVDVGPVVHCRADRGRVGDGPFVVALDFLCEPAVRPVGDGAVQSRAAPDPASAAAGGDRLGRGGAADLCGDGVAAAAELGRDRVSVGVGADPWAGCCRAGAAVRAALA